jgi:superfamily I DNA/RNA helicase
MELSKLQQEILDKEDKRTVVMASSAAGKTRLITEKTRQLLRKGINPREIAVITFTNMAAEELRSRLGEDYKDGIFIGTIHSLANFFLLSNGIDTSKVINAEKFDKLFAMVKSNPDCIKKLDYILLDEAQDSDDLQFSFLFDMINPENFFVVGDLKQSIYGWSGSNPDLLENLSFRADVKCYNLNENYRNGKNILAYAKKGIQKTGVIDDSIPMRQFDGVVKEIQTDITSIINMIDKQKNYKDWAILARTNEQVHTVAQKLVSASIPFDTFKQGDLKKAELAEKILNNTVKVLTIHSAKGLEWDNVVVIGAQYYKKEELNVNYVAATRARNALFWVVGFGKENKHKLRF